MRVLGLGLTIVICQVGAKISRVPASTFPIVALDTSQRSQEQKLSQESESDKVQSVTLDVDFDEIETDAYDEKLPSAQARKLIGTYVTGQHGSVHRGHHGQHHRQQHGAHHRGQIRQQQEAAPKITINELAEAGVPDGTGRICHKKVMMVEETRYDEVMTCDHSYKERCHTSYVTVYEPHQEEDCDEKFKKVCTISYEQKAINEAVEECRSQYVPDCSNEGPTECRTVYETVCTTSQKVHEVTDDVVKCETVQEKKCMTQVNGFLEEEKCDYWPVEKCSVTPTPVKKYTPETSCEKVPREMCAPAGCSLVEGDVLCQNKVKAVVINSPVEECDMEPQSVCKTVTKLVPGLKGVTECLDVPQEVCAMSKVNPRKEKRPTIQNWCYTPKDAPEPECYKDDECPSGNICESNSCTPGCRTAADCDNGEHCEDNVCTNNPGKVLLTEFNLYTDCPDCGSGNKQATVTLVGEILIDQDTNQIKDNSCTFNRDISNYYNNDRVVYGSQSALGGCWKAGLNRKIREGSGIEITSEVDIGLTKVCADWIDDQAPVMICDAQLKSSGFRNNEFSYDLVNCSEIINGGVLTSCPTSF